MDYRHRHRHILHRIKQKENKINSIIIEQLNPGSDKSDRKSFQIPFPFAF